MIFSASPPKGRRQLLVDDLDDLLGGGEVLGKLGPGAPRADPLDEVLDDGEIDVGLEQGDADLAENLGDLGVAEPAAAAKAREDSVETIGQGVEHGPDQVTRAATSASERQAAGRCQPNSAATNSAGSNGTRSAGPRRLRRA